MADGTEPNGTFTLAALFDDTIDATHALAALRRARYEPVAVSLLVRTDASDTSRRPHVSQAVETLGLGDLGGWLLGLAALRVPGLGHFLGAGPLGAVLAAIDMPGLPAAAATDADLGDFETLLIDFGFSEDEAGYVASRLEVGAPLVALTAGPGTPAKDIRRVLADHSAVYLGTAETSERFLAAARLLLDAPPETSAGEEVEVADAVGPLRRAFGESALRRFAPLRGRRVIDAAGNDIGAIDDVLVECIDPDGPDGPEPERQTARYVVVAFGGVLGIGRKRVAIPVTLADMSADPARLRVERDVAHAAPAFDDQPFSRRDEQAINAFFGERPYWLGVSPAAPASAETRAESGEPPLAGGLASAQAG